MNSTNVICFAILASLVAISHAAYDQESIKVLASVCNGTKEDTDVSLAYKVPETPSGKCLMLCFLQKLSMLDLKNKYDEVAGLAALRKYWSEIKDDKLQNVNSVCVAIAKSIESEPSDCEYGYQVMKCINSEFLKGNLLSHVGVQPS